MFEIQKCPNLVRGGQHFSKMSEIEKCLNYPMNHYGLSLATNYESDKS